MTSVSAAASCPPSPSVPSALTVSEGGSAPLFARALGAAAPAEQTPAIMASGLVERFPEKTPSARAARVPRRAGALQCARQAGAHGALREDLLSTGKKRGAALRCAGSCGSL